MVALLEIAVKTPSNHMLSSTILSRLIHLGKICLLNDICHLIPSNLGALNRSFNSTTLYQVLILINSLSVIFQNFQVKLKK